MTKVEIEKAFLGLEGINEAKKVYKTLARKLHPDVGGSDEMFKWLNEIYNNLIEKGFTGIENSEFDVELEKVIAKILHFENLLIEVIGSWIWLSGNTKDIKETLKGLGFKWASKKKMWYYGEMKRRNPHQKSLDEIKEKYGCTKVKSKAQERLKY